MLFFSPSGMLLSGGEGMDQKKTGALIRMLRQEKGLTQRQVAQALAVDHRAVSKWERGVSQS